MYIYYKKLINLANKAKKNNCIPIGAIVVKQNKIISSAFNKRHKTNNILDHAEIIAIKKANKKLKNWNLSECELYVTMIPCDMCMSVINETRIKRVYYILDNKDYQNRKQNEKENIQFSKVIDVNNEYSKMLKKFFKKLREKE